MADEMTTEEMVEKVLFPETHRRVVTVKGVARELHPLPIGPYRKIIALSREHINAVTRELDPERKTNVDVGLDVLMIIHFTILELARVYGWHDITKSGIDDLSLEEAQGIIEAQLALNEENDFLVAPLKVALGILLLGPKAMGALRNIMCSPGFAELLASGSLSSSTSTPTVR